MKNIKKILGFFLLAIVLAFFTMVHTYGAFDKQVSYERLYNQWIQQSLREALFENLSRSCSERSDENSIKDFMRDFIFFKIIDFEGILKILNTTNNKKCTIWELAIRSDKNLKELFDFMGYFTDLGILNFFNTQNNFLVDNLRLKLTPLEIAIRKNRSSIVISIIFFIKNNLRSKDFAKFLISKPYLAQAVEMGALDVVETLLQVAKSCNCVSKILLKKAYNMTPLEIANKNSNKLMASKIHEFMVKKKTV